MPRRPFPFVILAIAIVFVLAAIPRNTLAVGGVSATFGPLNYTNEGRTAEVLLTINNTGISQGIAGGNYYFVRQQDGNRHDVTLLGVNHQTLPLALPYDSEYGIAPLWKAHVVFTDGMAADFFAGCQYLETVYATGWEPTFIWSATWPGGWFDCGNAYQVNPQDIAMGASGSSPLTIYLQHPRAWNPSNPVTRRVQSITISLYTADGTLLENVGSMSYSQ